MPVLYRELMLHKVNAKITEQLYWYIPLNILLNALAIYMFYSYSEITRKTCRE